MGTLGLGHLSHLAAVTTQLESKDGVRFHCIHVWSQWTVLDRDSVLSAEEM